MSESCGTFVERLLLYCFDITYPDQVQSSTLWLLSGSIFQLKGKWLPVVRYRSDYYLKSSGTYCDQFYCISAGKSTNVEKKCYHTSITYKKTGTGISYRKGGTCCSGREAPWACRWWSCWTTGRTGPSGRPLNTVVSHSMVSWTSMTLTYVNGCLLRRRTGTPYN